ncbi:hypothetical protein AB6A40_010118 [Gnathostoma spinigerum]|uniref:Uncharacterized protein n=1 Tax=Gnathostoma spinigerum TaxID=75299 RepID=A0ABD6EZ24_9BILA
MPKAPESDSSTDSNENAEEFEDAADELSPLPKRIGSFRNGAAQQEMLVRRELLTPNGMHQGIHRSERMSDSLFTQPSTSTHASVSPMSASKAS